MTPQEHLQLILVSLSTAERQLDRATNYVGKSAAQTAQARRAYRFGVWKMANEIRTSATIVSRQMKREGI